METTRTAAMREATAETNRLRREARERWALVSPFRQSLYIAARRKGASPEEAIRLARGNLRARP